MHHRCGIGLSAADMLGMVATNAAMAPARVREHFFEEYPDMPLQWFSKKVAPMFRVLPPVEYTEVNKGNWPVWWKNMSANGSDVAFAHAYEQSKQQWAPLGEFMGLLVSSLGAEAYLMTRAFGAVARGRAKFYRAMSNAEYAALEANQGLTYMTGKELFVSSEAAYSRAYLQREGYDVLVQFNMRPGAMDYFNKIGVFHRTPAASTGWAARGNLLWKSEGGVMNLGIQQNTHLFNPWIQSFKKIP